MDDRNEMGMQPQIPLPTSRDLDDLIFQEEVWQASDR